MIKILKASAGSGKTYNLALEYIGLILGSDKPDAYRHVLAVTFTNKATDEMKRRIIKELATIAKAPEESPYKDKLPQRTGLSLPQLQKKAQEQLSAILHDYSAFAVSTIDRFFQQTLRAFSHEIGQFSSYQVQLDREELVAETVDMVLDGLSEQDRTLLDWLTEGVKDGLEQNGVLSLDKSLTEVAKSLSTLPQDQNFPREKLDSIRKCCREITESFPRRVADAAKAVIDTMAAEGVTPEQTNGRFMVKLLEFTDPKEYDKEKPTPAFVNKAQDPDKWFAKANANLKDKLEGVLEPKLQAFLECFGQPYKEYITAKAIAGQLYGLGMAQELRNAFQRVQKEKNVISLDDSNIILKNIIDGSDAPFIYEKLGVRYEDFLLDEFQDTADIQWENISPLLHNSEAGGNSSLVVGDVKQSIYRWRGSDWKLLGSRLENEFQSVDVKALDGNHRTCREIVNFNNTFFTFAAVQLGLESIYADVTQTVEFKDPAPGHVEVKFVDDQMEEIQATVMDIHEKGGLWSDMAILVRFNKDGSAIASALVENGIPVVSDDSLYVKSSVTVRRLVSQLSLMDTPADEISPTVAGFMAGSMEMSIPDHYHSLIDLAESLLRDIRAYDPLRFNSEVPYIQSFMDYLQDWVSSGGNNLSAFLKSWKDADPKIASPQTGDSVRIMTVHKAKGLEFPYVIVPYADKITLYKASPLWASPNVEGSALEGKADGMYHVKLESKLADSLFGEEYLEEVHRQSIDNLNVFYVALTRAKYGLKIISAKPPKKLTDALAKGTEPEWGSMGQLLYGFLRTEDYACGQFYPPERLKREKDESETLQAGYESFPADSGNRLRFSPEAADYFGDDGSFGIASSRRIRGNVLHAIMAGIKQAGDLEKAVDAAVSSGDLPAGDRDATLEFLKERLNSVQDLGWFAPEAKVLMECPIIAPDGEEYRPDRVVMHPDGRVTVVDYKFGEQKEGYRRQVLRYENLYRKMGYEKVDGYLWYLDDNLRIFVS